jgi:hypothetical protein
MWFMRGFVRLQWKSLAPTTTFTFVANAQHDGTTVLTMNEDSSLPVESIQNKLSQAIVVTMERFTLWSYLYLIASFLIHIPWILAVSSIGELSQYGSSGQGPSELDPNARIQTYVNGRL